MQVFPRAAPAPASPAPDPSDSDAEVMVFRGADAAYLRWIAEHPGGLVVNAERNPKPSNLKLHSASCTWMSGRGKPGAYTERDYIKICLTSRHALERWAREGPGGPLDSGCTCT